MTRAHRPRADGETIENPTRRGRADDDGIATVWAATAVAVLIGVLVAMLDLGAAVAARHQAETAADLAALAAAGQAVRGAGAACARAADVAAEAGGHVVRCRLLGWIADVDVGVEVRLSMLGSVTALGRARAGPASPDPTDGPTHDPAGNPTDGPTARPRPG